MKYRESGMPEENYWNLFFNPSEILKKLEVDTEIWDYLDVGCGYGTFLFTAASMIKGRAIGIDIERDMIEICGERIKNEGKENIILLEGDISDINLQQKIRTISSTIDYASLFNILHCEKPVELLNAVSEVLTHNGRIGVIHWNYADTPRGPSMGIRPKPDDIVGWAKEAGLKEIKQVDLPPYHYGLLFQK